MNKVEVIKFSASWCAPCRILAQTLKNVEGIKSIDVDSDMETARKFNVRNLPTLVFLKNGVEIHRKTGNMTLEQYNNIIDEIKFSKELNN